MRVIIVNDQATVNGGAAKVALLSAKELAKRGHEVHFLSGSDELSPEFKEIQNLTFHSLGRNDQTMGVSELLKVGYIEATYDRLRYLISLGDPKNTVVHLHCWKTGVSSSPLKAAEDTGAKFVVTFHDYHVACPQGQFFNKQTKEICRLKPGSLACAMTHCTESRTIVPKWAELYRHQVQRSKGGIPDRLRHAILLSFGCERIIRPYLPKTCKIHHVDNPIQTVREARIEAEKNQTIVFSGRLSPEKDPMILLKACQKVEMPVRFLGDGPLMADLKAVGYEKATFSGWLTGDQVLEEMNRARAMVISSIWYEVKPLAPLEAMGKGIPVVASSCTTTTEEIEKDQTGLIYLTSNVNSLAEQLQKLKDNEFVRKLSMGAYLHFWGSPPTVEHHVDQLEQTYEKILKSA
jgi:glycosyltransferase involved in cell wall biosynthesis